MPFLLMKLIIINWIELNWMCRALDRSFDVVWMNGPGKTCLSVKGPQRWYQITNFTRAFTVKISVEQRQTSYISSMAQRGEWTSGSTISDKTNCTILHTVEKLQVATRCSRPYMRISSHFQSYVACVDVKQIIWEKYLLQRGSLLMTEGH